MIKLLCTQIHPIRVWDGLDILCNLVQAKEVTEVVYPERFHSIVEVCKASCVNFAILCTSNVDIMIESLHSKGKITKTGKYKDEVYSTLTKEERALVDKTVENFCLETRFLLLAADNLHYKSKQ